MNTINLFFLVVFLFHFSHPNCIKGTLKCDLSNPQKPIPQICDFPNFFFFDIETNTCKKKSIPGCQIPSYDFENIPCFKCNPGLILDQEQLKCKIIPNTQIITDCLYYSCLLYTSPSPRDGLLPRMPSSA